MESKRLNKVISQSPQSNSKQFLETQGYKMTENELQAQIEVLEKLVGLQQQVLEFLAERVKVLAMKNQISFDPPFEDDNDKEILDSYI
jgi:hypothetical protein